MAGQIPLSTVGLAWVATLLSFRGVEAVSVAHALLNTIHLVDGAATNPRSRPPGRNTRTAPVGSAARERRRSYAVLGVVVYVVIWAAVLLSEVSVMEHSEDHSTDHPSHALVEVLSGRQHKSHMEAPWTFVGLSVGWSVLVNMLALGVQVGCLAKAQREDDDEVARKAAKTGIHLTICFVVCAMFVMLTPLVENNLILSYVLACLPYFVNSTLYPIILLYRVESLRSKILGRAKAIPSKILINSKIWKDSIVRRLHMILDGSPNATGTEAKDQVKVECAREEYNTEGGVREVKKMETIKEEIEKLEQCCM